METKWILVTQQNSVYYNKILELKEGWTSTIYNGTIVWFIESVNGQVRHYPDWFELNDLPTHTVVTKDALNLLAFL